MARLIGPSNLPTGAVASGIWSMMQAQKSVGDFTWPTLLKQSGAALALDFDETISLDSRISFTRATSGTYFDSSGVLQTAISGQARFDHRLESGVWVNKGLLIEEQRTNLSLRSEEAANAFWNSSAGLNSIGSNVITAPDGTTTADSIIEDGSTSIHGFFNTGAANSGNTTYTISVFAKKATRKYLRLGFVGVTGYVSSNPIGIFDLDAGTVSYTGEYMTATIQDYGNGWYRCSVTGTTVASPPTTGVSVSAADAESSSIYTGVNGTTSIYVWGMQREVGAFPTSYIKTTSASVTRNADVAQMTSTNFSDWYNATEGTVFWQGQFLSANGGGSIRRAYTVSDNTANEFLVLSAANASDVGSIASARDGGVNQAVLNSPDPLASVVANQTYKHGFAYKADDFAATLDGISPTTDTSGTLPTVDRLYLGTRNDGTAEFLNGHLSKFYYWNTRKSNSFLQNITS